MNSKIENNNEIINLLKNKFSNHIIIDSSNKTSEYIHTTLFPFLYKFNNFISYLKRNKKNDLVFKIHAMSQNIDDDLIDIIINKDNIIHFIKPIIDNLNCNLVYIDKVINNNLQCIICLEDCCADDQTPKYIPCINCSAIFCEPCTYKMTYKYINKCPICKQKCFIYTTEK